MVSIGTITNNDYLGIGIFLTILTAAAIAMRIGVSLRQHKTLLLEDWLSIIGFVLSLAFYVFNEYQYKRFFMPPDLGYFTNTGIAVPIMAAFSLWFSKAPVLFLYLRLFNVRKHVRYACRIILVVSALGFIGSLVSPLIHCHPRDTPHTALKWKRCGSANLDAGVTSGTVSVAADVAILVLPLRSIMDLHLSSRRKFGILIVFCSGIFGVIASVVSLVYKIHLFSGGRGNNASTLTTMLLQYVESVIALMVGCVPAIRGFWKGSIVPSKLYGSMGSLRSKLLSARTSRASSQHTVECDPGYHNENHDIDKRGPIGSVNEYGTRDTYVLMDPVGGRKDRAGLPEP